MPLNSTAGPLPSAANGTRIRLSAGAPEIGQHTDDIEVLGAETALLESENAVFRCRQRNRAKRLRPILNSASLPTSHEGDCPAASDALASTVVQVVHGIDALRDITAKRDIAAAPD